MKYSSLQISVVDKISDGVIYDIDTFLKDFFEYENGQYVGGHFDDFYEFKNGQSVFFIKNKDELIYKTAEFISLIEYLKSCILKAAAPPLAGKILGSALIAVQLL